MRLGPIRILWVVLLLLAAFVVFIEVIADVGGSAEPLTVPAQPVPSPSPASGSGRPPGIDSMVAYSNGSSSNTSSLLS